MIWVTLALLALATALCMALGTGWLHTRYRLGRLADDAARIATWDRRARLDEGMGPIGRIGGAFNLVVRDATDQLDEARRRDDRLRELLADLAHDVRTPLSALKLGLGSLPDAGALRAEVEHLDGLFANVATLVQLEASRIPLRRKTLPLGPMVERVIWRFGVIATDRGVSLNGSVPEEVLLANVDPVAFEQAVGNLVHNAVKFCRENVAVVLTAEGDEVALRVLDDGPGVTMDEVPALLERGTRGPTGLDRGRPGQGLGLAIARSIAEGHHGALIIGPCKAGGTCAEIRVARVS
ncbi:MAG: HAMP domain-containing histidine kinase [Myxococcales bacterium]|nr:HAMP domain-containing histidine kinase [Myxococcales bacterium]